MKVHQYVMMSAPTAAQYAGVAALDQGEAFVAEMVAEYDRRRRLIVDGFRAVGLPTFEPRGAFYAFPDISVHGARQRDLQRAAAGGGARRGHPRQRFWRWGRGLRARLLRQQL